MSIKKNKNRIDFITILLFVTFITTIPLYQSFASDSIIYTFLGGIIEPVDGFDDQEFDMGFIIGGHALLSADKIKNLEYGFELSYAMSDGEEKVSDKNGRYDATNDFSTLVFLPTARYHLFSKGDFSIYAQAGIGIALEKTTLNVFPDSQNFDEGTKNDVVFGYAAGAGIHLTKHFDITFLQKSFDHSTYFHVTLGYIFR